MLSIMIFSEIWICLLPVISETEGWNACALAEAKYGAGRGARNVVFMTFGTGLGAGIVVDGRLYVKFYSRILVFNVLQR